MISSVPLWDASLSVAPPIRRIRIRTLAILTSACKSGPLGIRKARLPLRRPFSFSPLRVVVGKVIVRSVRPPVISCSIGK